MFMKTEELLLAMGVLSPDVDKLARFNVLREMVEKAIISYVKWDLTLHEDVVEYYDGNGYRDIVLRNPWVAAVSEVRLDVGGAYNQASSAFGANTILTQGRDWALVKDGRSGLLRRLTNNAYWFPSDLVYLRSAGGLAFRGPAVWPACYGGIKVTYTYGFEKVPDDVRLALVTAVSIIKNTTKYGWPVQSESMGDYSYSLAIQQNPEFGTVRQLLASYKDVQI